MAEQTPPDFRALITEYVAGKHRATRHVDVCLDPDLADRIAAAQDALSDAESEVEAASQDRATIASTPAGAKKAVALLRLQRRCVVRLLEEVRHVSAQRSRSERRSRM